MVCDKDVDNTAAAEVGAHQIAEFERRLSKECFTALALQGQNGALDGSHRLCADQTVLRGDLFTVVGDEPEEGTQIIKVEQQHTLIVGQFDGDFKYSGLDVVEFEDSTE